MVSPRPPPGNPDAPVECIVNHKTPALPQLPAKPVHPVTVHWQPNRKPAAPPADSAEEEQRRSEYGDVEVEPEFFGQEYNGKPSAKPCSEEAVVSDVPRPSSSHRPAVVPIPSATTGSYKPAHIKVPATTVAPVTTSSGIDEPYTGGYVLNLAGPQLDATRRARSLRTPAPKGE